MWCGRAARPVWHELHDLNLDYHKHKKGMIAIISTILQNLKEILPYVPTCLIGAAIGMVPIGIRLQKNKKLTVCNTMWWYSMIAYILLVSMVTFFSREPGSRVGVDLQLFSTWGASTQEKAYVIENIIMFIPLGMLRALRKTSLFRIKNVLKELCVYTGISCAIEGIQLVTGRGYCQIDDVVMNVLGGVLGYLLIRLLKLLFQKYLFKDAAYMVY